MEEYKLFEKRKAVTRMLSVSHLHKQPYSPPSDEEKTELQKSAQIQATTPQSDQIKREATPPPPLMTLPPELRIQIADHLQTDSIKKLRLAHRHFAQILGQHSLTNLKIRNAEDIEAAVKAFPHARSFDLSRCPGVTDEHLRHLAKCSMLKTLNLSGCTGITDDGLADLKGMPLTSLDLSGTLVTDNGIADLKGMPLTSLNLSATLVTDAGLAHP